MGEPKHSLVCKYRDCNLARLSRLLRILRFHARDLKLKPFFAAYMRRDKGAKQHIRFVKSGYSKIEEAYASHFVWPGKGLFRPPASKLKPLCGKASRIQRLTANGPALPR